MGIGIIFIESTAVIGWIPHRMLAVERSANPSPLGLVCPAATCLVTDDYVYIEVNGCVFYGLSERNSVLPKIGSIS